MANDDVIVDEAELEQIMKRWAATTPGSWKSFVESRDHFSGSNFIMVGEGTDRADDIELTGATVADQDFVANAKQDIPKLVSEIKRLKTIVDGYG